MILHVDILFCLIAYLRLVLPLEHRHLLDTEGARDVVQPLGLGLEASVLVLLLLHHRVLRLADQFLGMVMVTVMVMEMESMNDMVRVKPRHQPRERHRLLLLF